MIEMFRLRLMTPCMPAGSVLCTSRPVEANPLPQLDISGRSQSVPRSRT